MPERVFVVALVLVVDHLDGPVQSGVGSGERAAGLAGLSLRGVVLVMDIRHPLRPFDEQMLKWCESSQVSCHVLLTKADKLKRGPAQATLLKVRKSLPFGATAQVFSASRRAGLAELIAVLNDWYEIDSGGEEERSESGISKKSG